MDSFSRNETIALMHRNSAYAMRQLSDYIEKHNLPISEIVRLLHEIADEQDAHAVVCDLRDQINL
jgi:hypothetical protein